MLFFPISFFNNNHTGYLVSRFNEISSISGFFSANLLNIIKDLIKFIGALFFLLYFNVKLTLISIIFLPLLFEISRRYSGGIRTTNTETMEQIAKAQEKIQETFSGIEQIKLFTKEKAEVKRIGGRLRKVIELEIIRNLFALMSSKLISLTAAINILLILWVGGYEIIDGRLTVGQYVAFVSYLSYLTGPVQSFAHKYLRFQRIIVTCKRVSELISLVIENNDNRTIKIGRIKGDITFQNVFYSYENNRKYVLKNINLYIKNGQKVAFVGISGSGKRR